MENLGPRGRSTSDLPVYFSPVPDPLSKFGYAPRILGPNVISIETARPNVVFTPGPLSIMLALLAALGLAAAPFIAIFGVGPRQSPAPTPPLVPIPPLAPFPHEFNPPRPFETVPPRNPFELETSLLTRYASLFTMTMVDMPFEATDQELEQTIPAELTFSGSVISNSQGQRFSAYATETNQRLTPAFTAEGIPGVPGVTISEPTEPGPGMAPGAGEQAP